jgi:hypothetical protein
MEGCHLSGEGNAEGMTQAETQEEMAWLFGKAAPVFVFFLFLRYSKSGLPQPLCTCSRACWTLLTVQLASTPPRGLL